MEILAPVGNIENLKLAVAHGADAVYFGASVFNARAKCQEINLDNLKQCVEYAHFFGVKVYLTVNTIIKDEEIDELIKTLKIAVDSKVDAFIIQDLAVYYLLKNYFSNAVLHASTQMGIHNLDGALQLEKLGFKRVVLSRETTLEDIREIHEKTNLEIEYFIQGALCVAFSGNCYLSSMCNNKSGNRGECLQLCRLKYTATQNGKKVKDGYLLSPSDLCLIKNLQTLKDAGVCSLKIEGRMRRGAYVSQSVESYKSALNGNFNMATEIEKLRKVFSRGDFNYGKYLACGKNIIYPFTQNHIGIEIGKVVKVEHFKDIFKIEINSPKHKIVAGDGLKFIDVDNSQKSMGVGNVEMNCGNYIVFSKTRPNQNDIVYLTLDCEMEKLLCAKVAKLDVDVKIIANENEPLRLVYSTKKDTVKYVGEIVSSAKNCPLTRESLIDSIQKMGDTNFEVKNITCETKNAFIAKSMLNKARREACQLLSEKIIENYNKNVLAKYNDNFDKAKLYKICKNKLQKLQNTKNYYVFDNFKQIENIADEDCIFVYSPKNYSMENFKEFNNFNQKNLYLNLPLIANKFDIEIIDNFLHTYKENFSGVVAHNFWGLKYCENLNVVAGYEFNITNCVSGFVISNMGICDFVKSIEKQLANNFAYGKTFCGIPTYMYLAHCPQKTCFDKKCSENCDYVPLNYSMENGDKFLLRRTKCKFCYFELLGKKIEQTKKFGNYIDLR